MFSKVMEVVLFSDFIGMPMCTRHIEIKRVLKVIVGTMLNNFVNVYQLRDIETSMDLYTEKQCVQDMVDV